MAKPESLFSKEFVKNFPELIVTKIYNLSAHGTPDILAFHKQNQYWMTIELKVTKKNIRLRLSPHQVSFHVRHKGAKSFILIKHFLATCSLPSINLYEASQVMQLVASDPKLQPLRVGYTAIKDYFNNIK